MGNIFGKKKIYWVPANRRIADKVQRVSEWKNAEDFTGWQMQNDPKDRHVAAAAVKAGASVITTANLRDFRGLPDGLEVQSPDELLCNLFDLDPEGLVTLLRGQVADLRRPPVSLGLLLERLSRVVPGVVAAVTTRIGSQ
jgi:hypothetical protein